MLRRLAVLMLLAASPALAQGTQEAGRAAAEAFLGGRTNALWEQMTGEMRQALGGIDALDEVRAQLRETAGAEVEVLAESVAPQAGAEVYERVARHAEGGRRIVTRIAFDAEGRIAGFRVAPRAEPADSPYLDYVARTDLRLPFAGTWYVVWGGRSVEENYHAVDATQRFAMDVVGWEDGSSHSGAGRELAEYHCWARPILAPADAVVASAVWDLPDNPIGETDAQNPYGNHVVLDFGNGEFAVLAHLQAGSVTLRRGDRVRRGERVGACGNSGNTSEPHLHFQLQDGPDVQKALGLPARFGGYLADGAGPQDGAPVRGQVLSVE